MNGMRVRAGHIFPVVLGTLVASGCGVIEGLWEAKELHEEAEANAKRGAEQRAAEKAEADERMDALMEKFDKLEEEQARMEKERAVLEAELKAAESDVAKQEELEEKLRALDAKLAGNAEAQGEAEKSTSKPAAEEVVGDQQDKDGDPLGDL